MEISMKKTLLGIIPILLLTLGLAVCSAMGKKAESLSMIYGAAAVISLILLIGWHIFSPTKEAVVHFAVFLSPGGEHRLHVPFGVTIPRGGSVGKPSVLPWLGVFAIFHADDNFRRNQYRI